MNPIIVQIAAMLGCDLTSASDDTAAGQLIVTDIQSIAQELTAYRAAEAEEAQLLAQEQEQEQQITDPATPGASPNNTQQQPGTPAKQPAIAASLDGNRMSVSPNIISSVAKGRRSELQGLVNEGYIPVDLANEYLTEYCDSKALGLSLSNDVGDDFDKVVARHIKAGKIVQMGERTGSQRGFDEEEGGLHLSNDDIRTDKNPLVAAAMRRAKQFARK